MMERIPRWMWLAGLLGSLGGVYWFSVGPVRVRPPCPTSWPTHLDPQRLLVLAFEARPPVDAAQLVFEQDLQEFLLAGGFQIVPASSTAAQGWPPHCVANRLELKLGPMVRLDSNGKTATEIEAGYSFRRFGRKVSSRSLTQPATDGPLFQDLRQEIVVHLLPQQSLKGSKSPSLWDAESPEFNARIRAMSAFAEGRTGEAVEVLSEALTPGGKDAALHFRQGSQLLSWAEGMQTAVSGSKPWVSGRDGRRQLELRARDLLEEAGHQLTRSLELAPDAPWTYFARARLQVLLGHETQAEQDFETVLTLAPAHGAAALALGRLRLKRGAAELAQSAIDRVLPLLNQQESGLRAELLTVQSQALLAGNQTLAAVGSAQLALKEIAAENRNLRLEALASLALALERHGQNRESCQTWASYARLSVGSRDDDRHREAYAAAVTRCPKLP